MVKMLNLLFWTFEQNIVILNPEKNIIDSIIKNEGA